MDESLDHHVTESTPRGLIRRFIEIAEKRDTAIPFTNRVVPTVDRPAQGTQNTTRRQSRRISGQNKGRRNMYSDVLRRQSKQSTSFMDQTMNVSVIQGIDKTYSNIVAPDSDNSSVDTSIDLTKATRFSTRKRKLNAPPPAVMNKPPLKKKRERTIVPSAISAGDKATPEAQDVEVQPEKSSIEADAAENEMDTILQEITSPRGRSEDTAHTSTMSPDVSSLAEKSDGTYDFTTEYDDTLPNVVETRRWFRNQTASNKLILPSLIESLQVKQKFGGSVTDDEIVDTLTAPKMQATSPEKPSQEPWEAVEEHNELYSTSPNVSDDAISPPPSFRDSKVSRTGILHETNFSNDLGESTSRVFHFEESESNTGQDQLPETLAPVEDEDIPVGPQRSSSAVERKRSMGQVFNAATTTTRSSRSSVGKVSDTTTTPTRSSLRRSVGQVSPAKSSPRSVEQVIDATATTTPTRSSPRKNVDQVIATSTITPTWLPQKKSMVQVTDATTITTPTWSTQKRSMGQLTDATTTTTPTWSAQNTGQVTDATTTTTPTRSPGTRNSKTHTTEVLREADFSNNLGGNISRVQIYLEESKSETNQDQLVPVENEDISMNSKRSASAGQRKSIGQVTDAPAASTTTPTKSTQRMNESHFIRASATITPTRSAQRKSEGQVIDATTTPTRSSPRRSVAQVSATRSPRRGVDEGSTSRLSPRRSVGQGSTSRSSPRRSMGAAATTTPTKSAQRKSASQIIRASATITPTRSAQRKSEGQVIDATTTPTRSSPRRSMGQASATKSSPKSSVGKVNVTINTPTISAPQQNVSRNETSVRVSPQKSERVEETATSGSVGRIRMSWAGPGGITLSSTELSPVDKGAGRLLTDSEEEDAPDADDVDEAAQDVLNGNEGNKLVFKSESKKRESPKKGATSMSLPNDAENALLSDSESEYSLIPVPERPVIQHVSLKGTAIDDDEQKTSFPNVQALRTPRGTPKEQPFAPSSTAKVRQMTMREFLEKLKTKPVQPPLTKPRPLLPSLLGDAAPSTSQPKAPLRPKPKAKAKRKRVLPASLPHSYNREVFTHFAKCRVNSDAMAVLLRVTEIFWENLAKDLCALQVSKTRPAKSIQATDVEKLMKRQGLITSEQSLSVLVEQLLPMEAWSLFKAFPEPAENPFPPFNDLRFSSKELTDINEDD